MRKLLLLSFITGSFFLNAQQSYNSNKFAQLDMELSTPNTYRNAAGAPGHEYWQMRADYDMKIEIDDEKQRLLGEETVTYYNQSPDPLTYLWLQLDQNILAKGNETTLTETMALSENKISADALKRLHNTFDGGDKIEYVKDNNGKDLPFTIVKTMMRVDLPQPLRAGSSYTFKVKWWYNIHDAANFGGREGYEFFPKDGNYCYYLAQFFPRLCRYDDVEGWQHKQYLGRGEFALSFGNYTVNITVPDDHVVASTGELQNPSSILTSEQRNRLDKAKTASEPVIIVTQAEAEENEKDKSKGKKTWTYKAENVRDFAFATSRKFIWDAQGVNLNGRTVMAMSYYPKEGNPLWEQFSTRVVANTLRSYSKHTFDYPYPVAISTHASFTGMEYPMICFNFGRPETDGTYSERTKNGMIGVVTHEVGHNWFPMIVNSDERQWTWMDEGLNSFVEYLAEMEWDKNFPTRRGPANKIADYMKGDKKLQSPIMGNADVILQVGNNSYGKPAAALNILRETILGRELFDFAFKEYSNRWKFKHPTPSDFFRTMEDASGVDLDWFWRGWFYTCDHVDISLENVNWIQLSTKNPDIEEPLAEKKLEAERYNYISDIRNKDAFKSVVETDPKANDFYNSYNPYKVDEQDRKEYEKYLASLTEDEKKLLNEGYNYYQLDFKNIGGLVMPVILQFQFTDGTEEIIRIPAEIWRYDSEKCSKVVFFKKEVKSITLDPFLETADADTSNNSFPRKEEPSRFQLFKQQGGGRYGAEGQNPMQRK